jgi:hypothetical protein
MAQDEGRRTRAVVPGSGGIADLPERARTVANVPRAYVPAGASVVTIAASTTSGSAFGGVLTFGKPER